MKIQIVKKGLLGVGAALMLVASGCASDADNTRAAVDTRTDAERVAAQETSRTTLDTRRSGTPRTNVDTDLNRADVNNDIAVRRTVVTPQPTEKRHVTKRSSFRGIDSRGSGVRSTLEKGPDGGMGIGGLYTGTETHKGSATHAE